MKYNNSQYPERLEQLDAGCIWRENEDKLILFKQKKKIKTDNMHEEIACLGRLEKFANDIIQLVLEMSKEDASKFERFSKSWTLKPDSWICLNFFYERLPYIKIMLKVHPKLLEDWKEKLGIKPDSKKWSYFYIKEEIADVIACIKKAYSCADNEYRRKKQLRYITI